jgi:hypothetical protein
MWIRTPLCNFHPYRGSTADWCKKMWRYFPIAVVFVVDRWISFFIAFCLNSGHMVPIRNSHQGGRSQTMNCQIYWNCRYVGIMVSNMLFWIIWIRTPSVFFIHIEARPLIGWKMWRYFTIARLVIVFIVERWISLFIAVIKQRPNGSQSK